MMGFSDRHYLLEFVDRRGLEREVERLRIKMKAAIVPGENPVLQTISDEITHYFEGNLWEFETPIHLIGSSFQKSVWQVLRTIPPGQTRSYLAIAKSLDKPKAFRAVAQANGANPLAIIVPCHRVINADGNLGGYGGGIIRKQWLLNHEKNFHHESASCTIF